MMNSKHFVQTFRKIAMIEGISFLVLLFIAMPLKYLRDKPQMVTIVGYAHGVLFIGYIIYAILVKLSIGKSLAWLAVTFVLSLVPFGNFFLDKGLKKDERQLRAGGAVV